MDWNEVNCRTDCRLCNHKGTPSATKGSKYCESLHQGFRPKNDYSLLAEIKKRLGMKGIMRQSGKTEEDEDT